MVQSYFEHLKKVCTQGLHYIRSYKIGTNGVPNVDPDYGTIKTTSTSETIIIFFITRMPLEKFWGFKSGLRFTFISMPYPVQVIE